MTPTQALLAYGVAAALLTVTPGLDTALVLRAGAVEGRRAALRATLGIVAGCLVWGALAAAGLGALLLASQTLYDAIRIAGALYVVWLGLGLLLRALRAAPRAAPDRAEAAAPNWLARGLTTNLLNPKIGVFYVSFLPQFTPDGVAPAPWMLLLALLHGAMGLVWLGLLALGAARLAPALSGGAARRWLDGATGAAFIAVGGALAFGRR